METLTVCTYLTETPADQTRELSSDHKSRAHVDIVIELGKAAISTRFKFYKIRPNPLQKIDVKKISADRK